MATANKPEVIKNLFAFKVKNRGKFAEEYWASSGLGKKGLKSAESFNTYVATRTKGIDGFAEVKTADGSSLTEKLQADTNEAKAVKKAIATALKLTKETENAKEKFNAHLKALNTIIAENTHKPSGIISYLHDVKGEAVNAIKAQHQQELDELEKLFADDDFRNDFKTSMGIDSDEEVEALKTNIVANTKKSQDEKKANLEKELNGSLNKLHYAAKHEFERIAVLGDRYARDKAMRDEIDRLHLKNVQEAGESPKPGSVSLNADKGNAYFKGISVKDLDVINTINDRPIRKTEEGLYVMELNRLYQSDESVYEDMTSLAQTIRASGHISITMEINCKDPKKAEELGKKAYESCILAGFDPKKINITVNGEPKMSFDKDGKQEKNELFKSNPQRLKFAQEKAARLKQEVNTQLGLKESPEGLVAISSEATRKVKEAVQDIVGSDPATKKTDTDTDTASKSFGASH